MSECVRIRKIVDGMFKNFSPANVDLAEASTRMHMMKCKGCRLYLDEAFERKMKEIGK